MIVRSTMPCPKELAANLREISVFEIEKLVGDKEKVIAAALKRAAHVWTGSIEDRLIFACGVESSTIISDTAYLWILTTKLVDEHTFVFIRWSKLFIEELSLIYPNIHGYVHSDYKKSVVWLKWLGFTISPPDEKEPRIRRFSMERSWTP